MKTSFVLPWLIALTWSAVPAPPAALAQSVAMPVTSAPETPATEADGLTQVLQTISARSPDVLAAQAAQRQAQAQVEQARAAWFGKVDTYALSQHFNDPRLTRPITQPPNVALYPFGADQSGYGVDVQLPLDISRQIAAEVDAARRRASGAQWSAEDVRLRALLQGAALFRNLQALAGQRAALDKQLESLQAGERVAEAGLKVGHIARVNLLRVQAALAEVQASIANAQGQERKLRAQLAALMGTSDFSAPIAPPDAGPAAIPTDSKTVPPGIQAAQNALTASQSKAQAARRAQYPQFFINGGWNRNAIQWDTRAIDTWQIILGMRLNLWAGGGQRSAIDAAQAAAEEARQRLQGAEDNLRAAREGAQAQWNAQEQAYRAARSGLRAAEESARIEQDRFRYGLGSATDLIDAEAALARGRATLAGALAAWWQADDALRYALGEPPLAYTDTAPSNPPASSQVSGVIPP
jgi:outer membrane protein TolC